MAVRATTKARQKSKRAPRGSGRLDAYRAKRDFGSTPEPSGSGAPEADGHRFVVQRHRATSLHYDFRLEAAGVLLSWAVPKGPTLDPGARRLAMHVEDHPLEYFDFEGVIPAGEYGGGDVIVWDWGTWQIADDADPLDAVAAGSLRFDLDGEKLRGRFALVRKGPASQGEHWLLIHENDDAAGSGWQPDDHPRSVKSGRTNEEVRAAPSATWSGTSLWRAATYDELDALAALGKTGAWTLGGHELRLTNLDKVLFPADGVHRALTKRDLIRHYATVAPVMLPYFAGRPMNLHRYPNGVDKGGFWHKSAPPHAPSWIARWQNPDAGPGETKIYLVLDSPAALAWAANFGAVELHPWTSTGANSQRPTWAMIDIDPGENSSFDDVVTLARLHRTALEHLGVEAGAKTTGKRGIQIMIPVADDYDFSDTRARVERLSRIIGDTVPEMVSWAWEKASRRGLARLDYT